MSKIQTILILGLFGEKNIELDLSREITILIADNGVGKTTILGIVYAVLSGQYHRLRRVDFHEIRVIFSDGKEVKIPSSLMQPPLQLQRKNPRLRRILHEIPEHLVFQLHDETRGASYPEFRRHYIAREISEMSAIPPKYLYEALCTTDYSDQLDLNVGEVTPDSIRESIQKYFSSTVLYFPTYRRIEEELGQLGYEKKERVHSSTLIQFGMADVHTRISNVTDGIKKSAISEFSKINGQMLSQLVDGFKVDNEMRESLSHIEALKIVLDRIGDNINRSHKQHIVDLIEKGDIYKEEHNYLVYFLSNLIKIYDEQRELDLAIKGFTSVCNRYLVDKEIVYNESSVDVDVYSRRTNKVIDLAKLSSGEKQIISLFSKLYLEGRDSLALLFDEPELSLSLEWQRMLLPDIMASGNCDLLLATTHSPFIFENEFDVFARDLREFTTY